MTSHLLISSSCSSDMFLFQLWWRKVFCKKDRWDKRWCKVITKYPLLICFLFQLWGTRLQRGNMWKFTEKKIKKKCIQYELSVKNCINYQMTLINIMVMMMMMIMMMDMVMIMILMIRMTMMMMRRRVLMMMMMMMIMTMMMITVMMIIIILMIMMMK